MSDIPDACNGEHTDTKLADDTTTTNNWSEGLDLRSVSKTQDRPPQSTEYLPGPVKVEIAENKDLGLSLNLDSGCATRIPRAEKVEYVAKWCKEQQEYTKSKCEVVQVDYRKPKNGKLSAPDKLIKRITHPFSTSDKKRLDEVIGQIANNQTRATLTDVQHSDFVQGRFML